MTDLVEVTGSPDQKRNPCPFYSQNTTMKTMTASQKKSIDGVFVWGVCDRTGYWHFYNSKKRADISSELNKSGVRKFSFIEAHEIHNKQRELMFSLPTISLSRFETFIEQVTDDFTHLLFHSKQEQPQNAKKKKSVLKKRKRERRTSGTLHF
ncbi:MAG: hypothetical protein P1Q69_04835 [Candidatus Thorarchaeota archaeon]|nr:hypothetical protein [Candidatus Thorarchaeota archaeon]